MTNKEINELLHSRKSFCGVGIKKIKYLLHNKYKWGNIDPVAEILRIALEIVDINIKAKTRNKTIDLYLKKENLIQTLTVLADKNNFNYGFAKSDIENANSIVYFDLPVGQMSWHTMLDYTKYKRYNGKWDGEYNSNLIKLEKYIMENYINKNE